MDVEITHIRVIAVQHDRGVISRDRPRANRFRYPRQRSRMVSAWATVILRAAGLAMIV